MTKKKIKAVIETTKEVVQLEVEKAREQLKVPEQKKVVIPAVGKVSFVKNPNRLKRIFPPRRIIIQPSGVIAIPLVKPKTAGTFNLSGIPMIKHRNLRYYESAEINDLEMVAFAESIVEIDKKQVAPVIVKDESPDGKREEKVTVPAKTLVEQLENGDSENG